jgi:hypothetical protein
MHTKRVRLQEQQEHLNQVAREILQAVAAIAEAHLLNLNSEDKGWSQQPSKTMTAKEVLG